MRTSVARRVSTIRPPCAIVITSGSFEICLTCATVHWRPYYNLTCIYRIITQLAAIVLPQRHLLRQLWSSCRLPSCRLPSSTSDAQGTKHVGRSGWIFIKFVLRPSIKYVHIVQFWLKLDNSDKNFTLQRIWRYSAYLNSDFLLTFPYTILNLICVCLI
jgi:hypothetical protein